jgi:hypothetical protein
MPTDIIEFPPDPATVAGPLPFHASIADVPAKILPPGRMSMLSERFRLVIHYFDGRNKWAGALRLRLTVPHDWGILFFEARKKASG